MLLSLSYGYIAEYEWTEQKRHSLTIDHNTGIVDEIPQSANMFEVAQFLGDRIYGVNFAELSDLEKSLSLIEEQNGAITLADLLNFHYQGGPFVNGTRLRDAFFLTTGLADTV